MKHTVSEVTFKNGIKGLLVHVPDASVVTLDLNFRAGDYLVKPEKWETPHIMEHLMLGANTLVSNARAFQAELEKNGAYNNASTSAYDITYEVECADFEWERVLNLMLQAVTKPLFLESEFKAEYSNVREELNGRSNNHFRHLSLALRKQYGFKNMTDQERLKLMHNVTLDDVRRHYERTHSTSNMRFVLAGNITPGRRETIEQIFSELDMPRGRGRRILPDEIPKRLDGPLYIINHTVDNLYFYLDSFMLRRMDDPESDALDLINTMLTETLYSKILGTARERGLVYHINSGYGQDKANSNWWFGAQVMPDNAGALFEIMVTELSKIFRGELDAADLEAAQAYALGRFQRSAQTVSGTASGYANRYFFDDEIEDYYQVPKRIKAITKTAIVDISRAMFADNTWGFGVLGNCGIDLVRDWQDQLSPLWESK